MTAEPVMGVLGGLGPEATLDFLAKVLAASGARRDQDHLHILVDCNPKVPDRNQALAGTGPSPGPALAAMARRLAAAGAGFLVMPCNTASHWRPDITQAAPALPFVGIVPETVAALRRRFPAVRTVGVLAADGCRRARLYEDALGAAGLAAVGPDAAGQARFMDLLYAVKAGRRGSEIEPAMRALALDLIARGAEAVVAGCTEVPLVLAADALPRPLLDSTAELATAAVAYARGVRPLPPAGPT